MQISKLGVEDQHVAILMRIFETNPYISALEFRKTNARSKTFHELAEALQKKQAHIMELNICDNPIGTGSIQVISFFFFFFVCLLNMWFCDDETLAHFCFFV